MNIVIQEEDKALLLLCSIYVSYKNFHETILYVKSTIFYFSPIIKKVMNLQLTIRISKSHTEALNSKGKK